MIDRDTLMEVFIDRSIQPRSLGLTLRHLATAVVLLMLANASIAPASADWEESQWEKAQLALKELRWKDYATNLLALAEHGHAGAQTSLGYYFYLVPHGGGDLVKAAKWHRRAAEQGIADSQSALAVAYFHGHGVPRDYKESKRWAEIAAQQGSGDAHYLLGNLYDRGLGVSQDRESAMASYQRAVELGVRSSSHYLAINYSKSLEQSHNLILAITHALVAISLKDEALTHQFSDFETILGRDVVNRPFINDKAYLVAKSYKLLQELKAYASPSQLAEANRSATEINQRINQIVFESAFKK